MNCKHDWQQGPFYLKVAATYEEPDYYPPSGMVKVEHCTLCGLLRLPESLRQYIGKNMAYSTSFSVTGQAGPCDPILVRSSSNEAASP